MRERSKAAREVSKAKSAFRDPRAERDSVRPPGSGMPAMEASAAPYADLVLPGMSVREAPSEAPPCVAQEAVAPEPAAPLIAMPVLSDALLARLKPARELYAQLGQLDAYALLGVPRDATSKDIRRAYFALSKRFHPDVFFRQPLGPYRRQLDAVFDALTRAHDTLRWEDSRAEYDASQGIVRASGAKAVQVVEPTRAPAPVAETTEPSTRVVAKPAAQKTEHEDAARAPQQRERVLRDLSHSHRTEASTQPGQVESRASVPNPVPATTPGKAPTSNDERTRESLLRELQRLSQPAGKTSGPLPVAQRPKAPLPTRPSSPSANPLLVLAALLHGEATGSKRWAATRLKEAHEEEKRGNVLEAASILRVVLEQVKDTRVLVQSDRLNRASERAATTLRERARAAELEGKVVEASMSWKKLAVAAPHDADAQLRAAIALLDAKAAPDAGPFALRAVELMPKNTVARQVLVRFFEAVGRKQSAELARAELAKLLNAKSA